MELEDIDTIAVLGAGNMGHGIAEVAALAGFDVRMRDIADEPVQKGYDSIEWSLNKLAEHGEIDAEEATATLERITPLVDFEEAVADADFVIEAVPEKMAIKKEVYKELEQYAPEDAVFATNTSALSVSELAAVTERPEQFCGMHFFNPPVRMDLVEVIAGEETAEETLELTEALARSMGKTPVRVRKDSPGFIANRVLVPLINEAAWMVESGEFTVEAVDSAVKYDMGLPMGAFELADRVGIDVGYHVLQYMHEVLGDAYQPCPLLSEKVEDGDLGQKSGAGFYEYDDGGPEVPSDAGSEEIVTRLHATMANEVAKLVDDDVADAAAIDEALMLGGRFPDGPARMADEAGLDVLYETLASLYEETGEERYNPAAKLKTLAEEGGTFHEPTEADESTEYETIRVEREERVGRVVIDRPHRMNTVSPEMLDELERAIEELEADDAVRALLLVGEGGRAFCAGADVQAVASNVAPLKAVELSRRGQSVFGALEDSDLPVVAGVEGYCLGGGMELATVCDLRVAGHDATFGQTELSLGLMPGWGGTQRLPNIVGEGRAKEIILTAEQYDAETMAEYGFVNELADDPIERAAELAADLAAGPPIAQRYTKRAIHAGRDDTEAGLELESQAFGHLLGTDDVMEGVTAFMSDRDPEFEGK